MHICIYAICIYVYIGRIKSFDLLDLSCLKTVCGVAEYRKVRFTWPGQRSIFYTVLKLYYFNVPEEQLVGPLC